MHGIEEVLPYAAPAITVPSRSDRRVRTSLAESSWDADDIWHEGEGSVSVLTLLLYGGGGAIKP